MYENLIETLRFCAKNGDCHDCPYEKPCAGTMGDGLYCEAADAIENVSKAYQMMAEAYEAEVTNPRWIPVTERLPGTGEIVLVYGKRGGVYTAEHNRSARWPGSFWKLNSKSHHCEPTHWMPLPTPPKEET